jgi:hypothetical protein
LWHGSFSLVAFVSACVLFRYWYLFGAEKFQLDLGKTDSGVSRAQLWRPLKIGAAISVVILSVAAWGLFVLARRPDLGFAVDHDREISTARNVPELMRNWMQERDDMKKRHENNLVTLSKKRLLWESDTRTELQNYRAASLELEHLGVQTQLRLLSQEVADAPPSAEAASTAAAESQPSTQTR